MYFRKTNVIPDPGQRVRLFGRRSSPVRGKYIAISGPFTDASGEVMIRVASEEGRRAEGMPWPVRQMEVVSSSEDFRTGVQETKGPAERRWWIRWFGG